MKVSPIAFLLIWGPLVAIASQQHDPEHVRRVVARQLQGRQTSRGGADTGIPIITTPTPTPTPPTPTTPLPPTITTPTTTEKPTTKPPDTPTPVTSPPTTSPPPPTTSAPSPTTTKPPTSEAPSRVSTFASVSTDGDGRVVTQLITTTLPATSTPEPTGPPLKALPPSTIIGLSVAGGVAAIGIIAFLVWKFARPRQFEEDEDEVAAIKWPTAGAPDSGAAATRSDVALAAGVRSADTYSVNTTGNSTADHDPYAVPPLPQGGGGGGYRDDPNLQAGGYYDPYRGPVPNTFADDQAGHVGQPWAGGAEAIPMSTYSGGYSNRGTPAPYESNRGTPAPYGANVPPPPSFAGRKSPAPSMAYSQQEMYGRGSPAPPQPGYAQGGAGGRSSPGPMAGGPGPNLHYDDPYGGQR